MTPMILLLVACSSGPPAHVEPAVGHDTPATAPAAAHTAAAPPPAAAPPHSRLAASEILVTWDGAVGASASVTRDEDAARVRAEGLLARVQGGEPFEQVAREASDGASAPRGGQLGVFETGTMVPDFEDQVAALTLGQTALVRTPFGYHVVRRDPVIEAHLAHIVVGYAGAWRSTASRSREEARLRALDARALLLGGEPLAAVASDYSEDATKDSAGDLGLVAPGQLIPAFEDAAFALNVGETSDVIETPYGFHVIQRLP